MPSEKEVYQSHADQYEMLILREDYLNNIPKEIRRIRDIIGAIIVELGAGTGRLTRFLADEARYVYACDASHHMLLQANQVVSPRANVLLSAADMRATPLPTGRADLVVAGWSLCYLAVWGQEAWRDELQRGLEEARRLLKPGGTIMLLENFGTGHETPQPPAHLDSYFDLLRSEGFQSRWFRTDYRFASLEEALQLSAFFFGDEMAAKVKANHSVILPECTGLLWLHTY
jgi:SAM-dependent methyltransferase